MANFVSVTNQKKNLATIRPIASLAAICVAVCGGGYSVNQTAQAMELQRKVRENGRAKKNNYMIKLI